jgi:hypothetical protein
MLSATGFALLYALQGPTSTQSPALHAPTHAIPAIAKATVSAATQLQTTGSSAATAAFPNRGISKTIPQWLESVLKDVLFANQFLSAKTAPRTTSIQINLA